ncbi:ferritin family protein [Romboutsia maritimum]|nr:ferritin family protein [Romboutsia maritimum]
MGYILDEKNLEIKVEGKNLYYAKLLLQDYSGAISELTASTQYFNHEGILFENYKEIAEVLGDIGKQEIVHLRILAKLINLLGINPKYRIIRDDNIRVWWCPNYIKYEKQLLEIIKVNIQGEKNAIIQYQHHLDIIDDKYIKEILRLIILDEKEHIEELTEIYNNIKNGKSNRPKNTTKQLTSNNENIMPNQLFTIEELQKFYNGENGRPAYVVIDKIVYDVSNIGAWGGGSHYGLFAGEDHTEEFLTCHATKIDKIKEKLPIVGYLKE